MRFAFPLIALFLIVASANAAQSPPTIFGDQVLIEITGRDPILAAWDGRSEPSNVWGAWQYLATFDNDRVIAIDLGRPWELPAGPWTVAFKAYTPTVTLGPDLSASLWAEDFTQNNTAGVPALYGVWHEETDWFMVGYPDPGSVPVGELGFAEAVVPESGCAISIGAVLLKIGMRRRSQ